MQSGVKRSQFPFSSAQRDRFFGAWLDEPPVETLGEFLTTRAEANGGPDLTVLAIYQLRPGQEGEALETLGQAISARRI